MVMDPSSKLMVEILDRTVWIHKCCLSSSSSTPKSIAVFFCSSVSSPSAKASLQANSSILGFLISLPFLSFSGNLSEGQSV